MRKPTFSIKEKKGVDQMPCFVVVQADLCQTWSETPKTGFLATQLFIGMLNLECLEMVFS